MNNVGETKTFILNGTTPGQPMRYVWKWWDGSVDVTSDGTVSKQLNMGGDPTDSFRVSYTCEAVNSLGASAAFSDAFVVNNPPSLVYGATLLSRNGEDFVFTTNASLIAYDLENTTNLSFEWFAGGVSIGAGVVTKLADVAGTYAGEFVGNFRGTHAAIDYSVYNNGSLICRIADGDGGQTDVEFNLIGQSPAHRYSAPMVVAYQATIDSATRPNVRIGDGQYAEFTVYTQENSNPTSFAWAFYGSNGWAATTHSYGDTSVLENNAYRNSVLKATQGEAVGPKVAECTLQDSVTRLTARVLIPVYLQANEGPVIVSTEVLPADPAVGDVMSFAVTGTDAEGDLIGCKWVFPDLSLTRWGRKVFVDSSSFSQGEMVQANLTVTDTLGKTDTQTVTSVALAAP